jgi:putative ABC transport system ATP-binding protein
MLELIQLRKHFSGCFQPTLDGLTLSFRPGDFTIVLGSNGSGKSTLMRCISGEYALDAGQVLFEGADWTAKNRTGWLASVVQDIEQGTVATMTLRENMALCALRGKRASLRLSEPLADAGLRALEEWGIGLEAFADQKLGQLSGGQRQLLATFMAFYSDPKVLLLDEHTAALDPSMHRKVMEFTAQSVANKGITTLMVTHKMDDALRYGNRLIMLHKGAVVLDVQDEAKKALSLKDLLDRFHYFEDLDIC